MTSSFSTIPQEQSSNSQAKRIIDKESVINGYKLHNLLGVGGMGEVYRATNAEGAEVALKMIRDDLTDSDEVRRRFVREARAAARLVHPNIAQLYDFGVYKGRSYMVIEFLDGETLTTWRSKPCDGKTFLVTFGQILSALAYAHARGIVHRDLKPENIVINLDHDGHPTAKVLDFGVAHFRDDNPLEYNREHSLVGTPAYMAPEQALKASDVSPASDIYAVGIMLFELLSGKMPFWGKSPMSIMMAHLKNQIPKLVLREGYKSRGPLEKIIQVFLNKDPTKRYMFAKDALEALQTCELTGSPIQRITSKAGNEESTAIPPHVSPKKRKTKQPKTQFGLFGLQDAPFCGRLKEVDRLLDMAQRVLDESNGGIVLIAGEMGIGKTRLARRFKEQIEEEGLMQAWVSEYASDYVAGQGIQSAILRGLGMLGMSVAEIDLRVSSMLKRHNVKSAWEKKALLELLTPETCKDSCVLSSEAARFALIQRLLEREGARREVLLLLEDIHLSDGSPQRLAEWLLTNRSEHSPWMLVFTYRSEQMPKTGLIAEVTERLMKRSELDRVDSIWVGPLENEKISKMVHKWIHLDPKLTKIITTRASGHPFFAVELLRNLVESGVLEGFNHKISPEKLLERLPFGISELLRNRLEVAGSARGVHKVALLIWQTLAVLGTRFTYKLAETMLRVMRGKDVKTLMRHAIQGGIKMNVLIEEETNLFRFESGILRDALIERAVEHNMKNRLERSSAEAKVRYYFDNIEPHAGEIAQHYRAARMFHQAVNYYLRAAEYAHHSNLLNLALESYHAVSSILKTERSQADELKIRTLLGCAKVYLQMANYEEASRYALQARFINTHSELNTENELPEATRILATVAHRSGNLRQARVLYEVALSSAERTDNLELSGTAHFGIGLLDLGDGRLSDAERQFLTAKGLLAKTSNTRMEASATAALGRVALAMGMYEEAEKLTENAKKLHELTHNIEGAAECLLTIGEIHFQKRKLKRASHVFERARADLLSIGAKHMATFALMRLATAIFENRGITSSKQARKLLNETLQDFTTMGDMTNVAVSRLLLAKLEIEESDWEHSLPHIEAALRRDSEERIDDPWFVEALVDIGRQAILTERHSLAKKTLETARLKLTRIASSSPLFDRTDEVEYLLNELESDSGEFTAVLDFES